MNKTHIVAVILVVLVTTTVADGQASFQGTWRGSTSQKNEIVVRVENEGIARIALRMSLSLRRPCALPGSPPGFEAEMLRADGYEDYPARVPITNGAFVAPFRLGHMDASISGKFVGATVKGTISITAQPPCLGRTVITWSAAGATASSSAPENRRSRFDRAFRLKETGQCKEALALLEANIQSEPNGGEVDYDYGWACYCAAKTAQYQKALTYYRVLRERFRGDIRSGQAPLRNWDRLLSEVQSVLAASTDPDARHVLDAMLDSDKPAKRE